jgi:uncharacterized HAD superfamily protein
MKIGFDIDGVVYDWHRALYPTLVHNHHTEKCFDLFWRDQVNGNGEIDPDTWLYLRHDESFYSNPPIPFVAQYLQWLNQDHELWFVTQRPPSLEEFTKQWFVYHSIPFAHITCVIDKKNLVKDLEWFVEDNPHNVVKLSVVTRMIVIKKPWNEHLRGNFPMYDNISQIMEF